MAWTDKVDDAGAQATVEASLTAGISGSATTTLSRSDFASFLDGTETVDDCHEFCMDTLSDGTNGYIIETVDFDLSDSNSELKITKVEPS